MNVELASGKGRTDENFPVASWLIRRDLRRHVHAYYNFARNADDIADHPTLTPDDKIARLDIMEAVLTNQTQEGSPSAAALRTSLAETRIDPAHARDLLIAFRQDATKHRTANWPDLMHYCRYSAAPVGRYVLALHGESEATWPASDALCASLQILNHIQDCAADFSTLDRSYLPGDWLAQAGIAPDEVTAPAASPPLRRVLDRMLAETRLLNRTAAALPGQVRARGLRLETALIATLARRLHHRLCRQDPIAQRVALRPPDAIAGLLTSLTRLTR